jgi:hypothetical protein
MSGLAQDLGLDTELPAALAALRSGWFEYGLVERSYAQRQPHGFARMVQQWGHTAIAHKQYTASAYIARVLGQLGRKGRSPTTRRPAPAAGATRPDLVVVATTRRPVGAAHIMGVGHW